MIAIDFETHLIDEKAPFPKPICLSYYDGVDKGLLVGFNEIECFLKTILTDNIPIIAHNVVFECGVIYYWFPTLRKILWNALQLGNIICTMIYEGLLNNLRQYPTYKLSLADLVLKYYKQDITEDKKNPDAWRTRYSELEEIPKEKWPKEAIEYAINDSVWAYKIYSDQRIEYKTLTDTSNVGLKRPVLAAVALNLMGSTGIRVDKERVKQLENEIYEVLEPKYQFLIEQGYCTKIEHKKRPKKNIKKLQELIKDYIKYPILSAKKNIKTDKTALQFYYTDLTKKVTENKGQVTKNLNLHYAIKIFKYFLDINIYDKVLTAYTKNLKTDLIRSTYSTIKSTGRTSSSSSKFYPSVNIQQMPRKVPDVTWDVRNCMIPREGYKMVSLDYSGLELASAAHQLYTLYGNSEMRNAINLGFDLHSKLAARIMSIKKNTDITYARFMNRKTEDEYMEMRQLCKAINLGFPGGIGYDTMRTILLGYGIKTKFVILEKANNEKYVWNLYFKLKDKEPEIRLARLNINEYALVYDELVGIKNELFNLYPELKRFLKYTHKLALTGNTKRIMNDFGEWESEPMYDYTVQDFKRNWCNYTAYCNGFLMQTPAAIGATKMMSTIIQKYLDSSDLNPLAFIHDEILFETKDESHIKDIAEIMIDEMQKILPSVRITVEGSIMNYWDKSKCISEVKFWKNYDKRELQNE